MSKDEQSENPDAAERTPEREGWVSEPQRARSERELTEAAANGDRTALEELLCRALPELRSYVRRQAGPLITSLETESDIVQSVCREILRNGKAFRHPNENAFRRWLYTTALRKLSNRHEKWTSGKRSAHVIADDEHPYELADEASLSASAQFVLDEELLRLKRAMDALSPEYREVIIRAKIGGESREEIGAQLGRSPGSTRMLLHRALAELTRLLGEE